MDLENYIFHFTGKLNQSYVMKSEDGTVVYEAICEKITLLKDTPYRFRNHYDISESLMMISHTVTHNAGAVNIGAAISSYFKVDKVNIWEWLSQKGYGYRFHLKGLGSQYDVTFNGETAGTIESAGTGAMNPKYKDSKIGQIPAKGIYRVTCSRENVPGFFMLCFAFSKTEMAMKQRQL